VNNLFGPFQGAEKRRRNAEAARLETISLNSALAQEILAELPYGTMLRVMSDAIVTHGNATGPATREFAQSIDRHSDSIDGGVV